jgi:hypothetical protein
VHVRRLTSPPARCLAGIAALLLVLGLAPAAAAAISVVGGLQRSYRLNPGEEAQGRVIVRNSSELPQPVRVYLTDYQRLADGTTSYGEAGQMKRSNAAWLHLTPAEQMIPPRSSASVHFVIRVPADNALSGTYWSMLMVEGINPATLAPPVATTEQVHIGLRSITRTGIQIATEIGANGKGDLRFLRRQLLQTDDGYRLQLDLENSGERVLSLAIWAELFDEQGISIGRFHAGQRGFYPGDAGSVAIALGGVPPGAYTALIVADNRDEHIFGARYELVIEP